MPMGGFRYLVGYCSWREGISEYYEQTFASLRNAGFDVEGICLTLSPPGPRLSWKQLDQSWRTGSSKLLELYAKLLERLQGRTVLVNLHGANLHPEFIRGLPVCTVFVCNDDPESSEDLSMPVAWAYDCCLVGNCAEVKTYRTWGIRHAYFQPMGFSNQDVHPGVSEKSIMTETRDIDLVLFCERESAWRRTRLDRIVQTFPDGMYRGRGWTDGFVSKEERLRCYGNARIGVNIHNSTGPINARTYELPANGVLQICDNKSHLAEIFELDREVIGFDTMAECIEKIRYYLGHENERREIAVRGYRRAWRDYHLIPCWERIDTLVSSIFQHEKLKLPWPILPSAIEPVRITQVIDSVWSVACKLSDRVRSILFRTVAPPVQLSQETKLPYSNIWHLYTHIGPISYAPAEMKLGILKGQAQEYEQYVCACQEMDVRYAVIDLTSDDWMERLLEENCDGYLARPPHGTTVWRDLYLERVQIIVSQLNAFVYPSLFEMNLYENKRLTSYWLKVHQIPHPKTHVFVNIHQALAFAHSSSYPIVYKTTIGSAGSGVIIIHNFTEAEKIIQRAFGEGIVRSPGDPRDSQWDYVIFQEYIPNAREFRLIRIGDSYFGHEKLPLNGMHSGSNLVRWGAPPKHLLELARRISEMGTFHSMSMDILVDKLERPFVNELQCVFGSYNPSQMYVYDIPGRYRYLDGEWVFEAGLYCRNGCANLRVETAVEMIRHARGMDQ